MPRELRKSLNCKCANFSIEIHIRAFSIRLMSKQTLTALTTRFDITASRCITYRGCLIDLLIGCMTGQSKKYICFLCYVLFLKENSSINWTFLSGIYSAAINVLKKVMWSQIAFIMEHLKHNTFHYRHKVLVGMNSRITFLPEFISMGANGDSVVKINLLNFYTRISIFILSNYI